jgi:hypothetical protein
MRNRREWVYKHYKCASTETALRCLTESQARLATAEYHDRNESLMNTHNHTFSLHLPTL